MSDIKTEFIFDIDITVGPPRNLGATPYGERIIVSVTGGRFEGPGIKGTIIENSGADWLLLRADGALQLDVRITLQTDDDALIYMTYRGIRVAAPEVVERLARGDIVDPSEYYFRTAPFFETASEKYGWLNRIVAVGIGERKPTGPFYRVYKVL
jgi:hypothetical protein